MSSRIDEIRARWARVSPTPWRLDDEGVGVLAADGSTVATHSIDGWWAGAGPNLKADDAVAIADAPNDVAYLLSEIDRLRQLGR
ncbi:MAG: hypothetical protein AAGF12_27775 [Myxococcota bacterium]